MGNPFTRLRRRAEAADPATPDAEAPAEDGDASGAAVAAPAAPTRFRFLPDLRFGAWLGRPMTSFHLLISVSALLVTLGLTMVLSASGVHSYDEDRSSLLVSCYRESLRVATELGATTIAFPAISTGVYGWPMDDGARKAVDTVRATLPETSIEEVRFVLFDQRAFRAFESALG